MALPNIAWNFGSKWPWKTYWYFRFDLLKNFRGFCLQIIIPIGSIYWRFNFPNRHVFHNPRFFINWRKSRKLVDGGLLFEKSWKID